MSQKRSILWIAPWIWLALGAFFDSAQAQMAPANGRLEEETDAVAPSQQLIHPATPSGKTPKSPSSGKTRSKQATLVSSKASLQSPDGNARGTRLRQPLEKPAITGNRQSSSAVRTKGPKPSVIQTSNHVLTEPTANVGLLETLHGMPSSAEHFEALPENADLGPARTKRRIWPFNDFVIPLPEEVGASFGVLPGCETRCRVESKFGPPDREFHASTYYTLADYSYRGLRFYYDKEDRTVSYSTFSPVSPGPGAPLVRITNLPSRPSSCRNAAGSSAWLEY